MSGANAALQLLPVAALIVDAGGALQGCNELFEGIAGVPHEILLGREWWQAFAARSAPEARRAHEAIVRAGEPRGSVELSLTRSDGSPTQLELRWLRVTEPGTRRFVWIFSAHEATAAEPAVPPLALASLSPDERAMLAARELDAVAQRAPSLSPAELQARIGSISRALRSTREEPHESLPVADVIKRAMSSAMLDPTRPLRFKSEARSNVRSGPADPARVLALLVEHARQRHRGAPVHVRVFERPAGVCFEVTDPAGPLNAELQAKLQAPKLLDRTDAAGAPHPLELASALTQALGGTFECESSLATGVITRATLPRAP